MTKSLYPTSTARKKTTKEPGLVYCTKCGFPCRTESLIAKGGSGGTSRSANTRFPLGSKAGKGVTYIQTTITIPTGTKQVWTPDVGGGCSNCGSYLYDQQDTRIKE